jgi:hypothetical protein
MDFQEDTGPMQADPAALAGVQNGYGDDEQEAKASDVALVTAIIKKIKDDKKYHNKAFKRMRRDMQVAMHGAETTWSEDKYKANIAGRHVRQKTAALYAKNPKATAKRKESLDFQIWDESQQSIMLAMQTVQMAATQPMVAGVDPMTGQAVMEPPPPPPGFMEAQALIADFQQGMARREQIKKFGRTLEILFSEALREQKPLDFKMSMKKVVRRAITTGVGYVELGFQREMGPRPGMTERLTDAKQRLDHLRALAEKAAEGEIESYDAEMAELEHSIAALQAEPEIVIREGLIFDFPQSTKLIPDKNCKSLVGFVGASHLSIEYTMTVQEAEELFDVDLGCKYTPYVLDGIAGDTTHYTADDADILSSERAKKDDKVCVWKYYDKPTGLIYYVCDGHDKFLRTPSAPEVFVSDFWPVYALTFNDVESEEELFPPSDVSLLLDMQKEYNRSRQGKREHRQAARPRWGYANGVLDEKTVEELQEMEPFDAIGMNIDPQTKLGDVLQEIPVPGVDPNLYDVNEIWADMQVVVGTQQAALGGMSKGTATEASISAQSMTSTDGSSIDDLDAFLSCIARAASQILQRNMSEEQVVQKVGPGAVWLPVTDAQIMEEVYLDVEAGSTGKPNQAVDINNWQQMLPFLLQMGSIQPEWLARETLRRLDDRMDLTEAVVAGLPSIMAMNSQKQVGTGDPATDPNQQGAQGGNNAERGQDGTSGSSAPMGDNRTTPGEVAYGALQ